MTEISSIEAYGKVFTFEPPIEIGSHKPTSLEKVTSLALMGHNSLPTVIDMGQMQVEAALDVASGDTSLIKTSLDTMLAGKHIVHMS